MKDLRIGFKIFRKEEHVIEMANCLKQNLVPSLLVCALTISILSFSYGAQRERRNAKQDVLPRVGTIKDYPATGLMTGCANLYFYPATQVRSSDAAYIFLARGDGSDAWVNLDGRDVRLHQIRSSTRENRKLRQYYYLLGKLRISVVIEPFKPENATVEEGDSMFKMKITLRRGRAVRIVRAVGDADC